MFHKKSKCYWNSDIFSEFMQFCYKSRFSFNVCDIEIVENIRPDEIHSNGETYG